MAKRDVISVLAKLIDKIKKGELAEEPNLEKKTWEEIQEMMMTVIQDLVHW